MASENPIPAALREARRWVCWRHLEGRKPPCDSTGRLLAGWNTPENWLSYSHAMAAYADGDQVDGVGFVLGDGWGGLDLDECRIPETGTIIPKAGTILDAFPNAYAEVSPSQKGIKVFGRTATPGFLEVNFKSGAIETKPSGYFCVTGVPVNGGRDLVDLNYAGLSAVLGHPIKPDKVRSEPLALIVPPGSQEGAMFREACRLRHLGYGETEIAKTLWALVEGGRFPTETGREPWTREDCAAKARAVDKYEPAADVFPTTDPGCAEYLKASQGGLIRHDMDRGVWLLFDNVRWASDQLEHIKLNVIDSLRTRQAIARASDLESKDKRIKELIRIENRVPTILEAAKPYFPSRTTEFDTDPYLLGVPNGVVDLRTGQLRAGRPEDNISMQTAVPYHPDAKAPLFEKTVATVFSKDGVERPDFVKYVQRAFGYSITGACNEEVFFLCTGRLGDDEKNGRNGKGTLVNTIAKVLGDYACDLGFSSLEWQRNGNSASATPDLAKLVHKRFVTASETNKGAHFNTARIKALTGRDPITARFLFKDEFTFEPELKLWLSVNHPPKVEDDSLGFWSRPHVVEFPNTFAATADTTLKDRLLLEAQGILSWLVRGAIEWQKHGLDAPPEVKKAVLTYQEAQGDLEEFLDECCVLGADHVATHGELWEAYSRWVQGDRRNSKDSSKGLGKRLRKRFGEPKRKDVNRKEVLVYYGVGIRTSSEPVGLF